jgi:hypothetical protein
VRLRFLERSDKKFVSRTIPLKADGIIPRYSAAEFGSRACPGVHTRDFFSKILNDDVVEFPDSSFHRMLKNIEWNFSESTFLDFGCGKGAAILLASR